MLAMKGSWVRGRARGRGRGRGRVRGRVRVSLEDDALGDPRRDEHGGGAQPQPAEVERLAARGLAPPGHIARRLVGGHALEGRHLVVVVRK